MILNLVVMVVVMNPFENMLRAMDHLHIVKYMYPSIPTLIYQSKRVTRLPIAHLGISGLEKA